MKAWRCDAVRPRPGLQLAEVETPVPLEGQVLVQVHAAGVTPSELDWQPTTRLNSGEPRVGAIPGHEFSGVIASVGPGSSFKVGDAVFGMNDWYQEGATAEFCCAPESAIVPKPAILDHREAAAIPIGALTAWQGLITRANVQAGERVLIHGGSGAVGSFAVQLAHQRGAQVWATASARHRKTVLGLGADHVIDYRTEPFETIVSNMDVVFDTVGGETLRKSWDVLRPGGRLITVAASNETQADERAKSCFFIVEPNAGQLREIGAQVVAGQLKVLIDRVVTFEEAGAAYTHPSGAGPGKTVVEQYLYSYLPIDISVGLLRTCLQTSICFASRRDIRLIMAM